MRRKGNSKQASIFVVRPRQCDSYPAGTMTDLIAKMLMKDVLPVSIVYGNGFRDLMPFIQPG